MDVERLRLLRELADRGTVSEAARALSLTPSAVSQQLKTLQRETGVQLLEPDGRRVRLTDAGRALVTHVDEVLAALQRAEAEMDAFRSTARGSVRVAMFPSGAAMLLAGLITRAADIGIDVIGRDVDQPAAHAVTLLADYDIVVAHRDERDTAELDPRLHSTFLLREPLEVVLPPGHRLTRRKRVALSDLAEEPWIGVELGLMVDDVLRSLAATSGIAPRIVQRVNDFRVVEELVNAGVGVALLPCYFRTVRALTRKPLDGVQCARRIDAMTRASDTGRRTIAAVLEILMQLSAELTQETVPIRSRAR